MGFANGSDVGEQRKELRITSRIVVWAIRKIKFPLIKMRKFLEGAISLCMVVVVGELVNFRS